ncbi:ImmA/IrrE family metallo-endopeptidase (plasmid) [Mycobacterium sp. SMC-8]|uniref:ImmA/IrrE family metallo-endopeptidase n=1 Tax=Mycobacterium sp. SMC-8 TaxID=2857060 RepID=UPI0021B45F19|nr:ImmA/IrrE family metallo-endopeptidase [Mycobacterium sp. SMC-8]UXA15849.1 ImmA/IrrE family metallo-endopeptidase [Mycobacterium sp. SMC-8]
MVTRTQFRHAVQEADSLLQELDINQEAPIDVFHIVDRLGLWLVFNPLKTLLGAAVPKGDGGIMLTTERGAAVQRFTAAHEIGHWVLDYGQAAFDSEQDIYHPSGDREVLAQVFASQLLMPPPLIYAACAEHGLDSPKTATPTAVYLVARDIGASYEAVARQLANLEIIGGTLRDELLKKQPAAIKSELCRGHRPTGAVDVWPLEGVESGGTTLTVTEGDEVVVLLPENRTTGHRWLTDDELARRALHTRADPPEIATAAHEDTINLDTTDEPTLRVASVDDALARIPGNTGAIRILPAPDAAELPAPAEKLPSLELVDDQYHVSRGPLAASERRSARRAIARQRDTPGGAISPGAPIGGTGTRLLALRSTDEGHSAFLIVYSSAYDPTAPAIETYRLEVDVKPTPAVLRRREYLNVDLDDPGDQIEDASD